MLPGSSRGAGERECRRGEELLRFGAGDDLRFAGDFRPQCIARYGLGRLRPRTTRKKSAKKNRTEVLERWNDDANLYAVALISLAALFLTLKMQSDVEINVANELPFKFPGRNTDLFPNPWPYKDRSGKGMTPRRDSKEWKAIIDFKESRDWETGDLKTFANFFGVGLSALSEKISASMEERRRERMFKYPLQEHRHDNVELQSQGTLPSLPLLMAPDAAESWRSGWEHAARRRRARPQRRPPNVMRRCGAALAPRRCHSPLPSPPPLWLWAASAGGA